MKKIIIILIGLLFAGTAFAKVAFSPDIVLPQDKVVQLYSKIFDQNEVKVIRFQDGNNTCYLTGHKNFGGASAISCFK